MEEMQDNDNNNLMEGLLNNQPTQERNQQADDSDLLPNQQDESSLIGDESEMSRNTNNISATANMSAGDYSDIIQKNLPMKGGSTSAIASSLLEASNLLIDQMTSDQLMESGVTDNEDEANLARTSGDKARRREYEGEEEEEDEADEKNNTYDVNEDEEEEEEDEENEDDDDEDIEADEDKNEEDDDDVDSDRNGEGERKDGSGDNRRSSDGNGDGNFGGADGGCGKGSGPNKRVYDLLLMLISSLLLLT